MAVNSHPILVNWIYKMLKLLMGNRVLLQTGVQQKRALFLCLDFCFSNSKTGNKDTENVTGTSLQESKI